MSFPKNPRAVVTGGASGLGRAICLQLAKRKARILIADIHEERCAETVRLVESLGGKAQATHCDVSKASDVEALAQQAMDMWGGVDIAVNNAGVACGGQVGDLSLDDWEWIMRINLWGPIYGCHYFLPLMKRQGHGFVLNVASAAGIASLPEMAGYNVTKAGVVSLSETLFGEVKGAGINVTVLCPTFFKTNLLETMRAPAEKQKQMAHKFFERSKITAEEVADQALKGLERGKLYIIPQTDGKLMWRLKRANPQLYFQQIARGFAGGMIEKFLKI
jgi:NAD(P)-dependent dehydrogenase (short-subunit alcohol dehydrogenase family)